MRRLLLVVLALAGLSTSGCLLPGDWLPWSGSDDTTYNSNTLDQSGWVTNGRR